MALLSLAEIVQDPDFQQSFIINRISCDWDAGGILQTTEQKLLVSGIITPQKTRDMKQTPQGDQLEGNIDVYTNEPIYTTQLGPVNEDSRLSDEVEWRNDRYRILSVENFADFGYYHAVATLKRGA